MGRNKKRFNWKARKNVEVITDNNTANSIPVEVPNQNRGTYDDANLFVLPSKKRRTTIKEENVMTTKVLSKKQRKRLEQIVARRRRKQDRSTLLQSLSEVQASPELMSKLTSIAEVQTKGLKRLHESMKSKSISTEVNQKIPRCKGWNSVHANKRTEMINNDPNVVGYESSSGDDSDSETVPLEKDTSEKICDTESALVTVEINDSSNDIEIIGEFKTTDVVRNVVKKEPDADNTDRIAIKVKNPDEIDIDDSEDESTLRAENTTTTKDTKDDKEAKKKHGNEVKTKSTVTKVFVPVMRDPAIQRSRLQLPILGEEQQIMETISENDVVIVVGQTGCGKTTQLPQFLYEGGYCLNGKLIGVTEPRRVAAISMSRRVAEELNLSSEEVSYLIRFEGNSGPKTKIKFMTDGVLLKEIQKDFQLQKYSVIILDEAHERSVYTDILTGLLSRILPLRRRRGNPLKLIIMSATLKASDFTTNSRLFKTPPPIMEVDARQYPVSIHFNKRTATDYLREAYNKVCKIHTKLPEGGILVFLTGQQEVNTLVRKLRKTFPFSRNYQKKTEQSESEQINDEEEDEDNDDFDAKRLRRKLHKIRKIPLPEINLDNYAVNPADDEDMELLESDEEFTPEYTNEIILSRTTQQPMWVLPLYSLLSSKQQAKVFQPPPEGSRLCVVATNVAETSLTIPGVKYVVDCGRVKIRHYDTLTGVSLFAVSWTSKASADQRAGRAGRTAPGHCYRLYSSAVFNDEFEEFAVPEIQKKPADDLVLQMKSLLIHRVVNFPFPTPPDVEQLRTAERKLTLLGALAAPLRPKDEWGTKLTPLGESMASFPVAPRFAKMLCLSNQFNLMPYTVAIVAALSVQEFLLMANDNFKKTWRNWIGVGNSLLLGDVMVMLRALGSVEYAGTKNSDIEEYCSKNGLRYKAVVEARKLRIQLTNELNMKVPNLDLGVDPKMRPPNDIQARQLRQLMLAGMLDQVARLLDEDELREAGLSVNKAAYRTPEMDDIVYINGSSVLKSVKPKWVVYQELYQTGGKMYMRGVTAIEPEWLPIYATPLCTISEPLKEQPPYYDDVKGRIMCYVSATFGRSGWPLPVVEMEYPEGEDRYRYFGKFFLEGVVCPNLAKFLPELLSPPSTIFKSWAKFLLGRTELLLKTLMSKKVDSAEKLKKAWDEDEKYLLDAYVEWLPKSSHTDIKKLWPPV